MVPPRTWKQFVSLRTKHRQDDQSSLLFLFAGPRKLANLIKKNERYLLIESLSGRFRALVGLETPTRSQLLTKVVQNL
jgi:hypothetical protein